MVLHIRLLSMNLLPMNNFTLLESLLEFFTDHSDRADNLEIDRLIEGVVTRSIRVS